MVTAPHVPIPILANETTVEHVRLLRASRNPDRFVVAEIGVWEGATSRRLAELLEGRGLLHLYDYEDRVRPLLQRLQAAGFGNVEAFGNGRRGALDSYCWSLMRMLQHNAQPFYDYVFIDGAHTWAIDGFAFLLVDRLLKPGGIVDFDDWGWSLASSPSANPRNWPEVVNLYSDEQIAEPQVNLIIDLLVKRDSRYAELVPNKIYQKLA